MLLGTFVPVLGTISPKLGLFSIQLHFLVAVAGNDPVL